MKSFFWILVNFLQGLLAAVWSALCILVALVVRFVTADVKIPLAMARYLWAPGLLRLGGFRIEVSGLEHLDLSTPCFFAANHQSVVDIPVMFRILPIPLIFIVKDELRSVPFLGWYSSAMGMIHLPRKERLQSMKNLQQCGQRIADGMSILMFPEGTRGRGDRVRRFKPGVFVPAIESRAPVVPVAIGGSGKCLPPGGLRVRPGVVRVAFGQPITTADLERQDRRSLAEEVRQRVVDLWHGKHADANDADPVH